MRRFTTTADLKDVAVVRHRERQCGSSRRAVIASTARSGAAVDTPALEPQRAVQGQPAHGDEGAGQLHQAKGMIYSPAHGDTAFTVPLFDDFMKRIMPRP